MFLIDKPFVSNFLIETIRKNNFKIVATKCAKELVNDENLAWIEEDEAVAFLENNPKEKLYSNSENALSWIEEKLGDSLLFNQISILKDKVKFRELLKSIFPDFYFQKLELNKIQNLSSQDLTFPFVIKPAVGFFSIGVHIVRGEDDWEFAKNELKPEKLKSIFPECVLNTTNFIIEEFIEGEEYAIDYYHDENGNVVLLNVLHHLFSSGTDTSDRVYSTSKDIIEKYKDEIEALLFAIGKELGLKNFPAHAELRIDSEGRIIPIEINPLRFGGFCTTGDLLGVTIDFNSYEYLFRNQRPNWEIVFDGKEDKKYSIIILNNNSGIETKAITNFDYEGLGNEFENAILMRKLDINKYPVFGFVFTESSPNSEEELDFILRSDLKKYLTYNTTI